VQLLIVCTRGSDVLQWGSSATRFSVCFEPFSSILLCLSCVEFSQPVALVVADLNANPRAADSPVVAHRVLNFLQRDLPLFEEDDEDFELGGGGQTGAGGEAGVQLRVLWVSCVVRLRV
jgi:hypothetical protein